MSSGPLHGAASRHGSWLPQGGRGGRQQGRPQDGSQSFLNLILEATPHLFCRVLVPESVRISPAQPKGATTRGRNDQEPRAAG